MNLGLFLDLDHTIIKPSSGGTFPIGVDDWELIRGIVPVLKSHIDKGYKLIIVTNQGGIEAGHITEEEFNTKALAIAKELEKFDISISKWYINKTLNKDDYYRKPNPGVAYQAAIEFELYLRYSIMVGDMDTDERFAKNAYIGTYYHVDDFLKLSNND